MANNIISKSLEQVMHDSMMPYSEFVILDRALPRVEDGLKPVQRRVLYSMLEVGVTPDKPYRKSARIVGDCMGKYHPHGDSSIYETMVRMAQSFNMREMLVDGHGNYGSIDGDGAAAMRYTEARLAPIALELVRDIEKNTVKWDLNFDDTCNEPVTLPGRFPNLLVNGSSGIAVGLSTNIPPHNLKESINAVVAYIDNRKISVDDLLKIMPGPDFPTGGYILKSTDISEIYRVGKGKLIIRAKLHIENSDNGKKNIVITELPYQVNKANLLIKIAKLKEDDDKNGHLSFIQDIVDESDRNGIRAVIKLKKDANVKAILGILYKSTDLQSNFNANIVAIADGKPKQLSLIEILEYYVNYQQKVILDRTKFDLESCLKKEHILKGLLIAINNIDDVVRIIKQSKSVNDAKVTLMSTFYLTDVQAQAILDMRLARLTSLEVNKLKYELERLELLIKKYTAIIKSPILQMQTVKEEILKIRDDYGDERRTHFLEDEDLTVEVNPQIESLVQDELLIITAGNTVKAILPKSYNLSNKDITDNSTLFEVPKFIVPTNNESTLYLFTDKGNCHKLETKCIELGKYKDKGFNLSTIIKTFEMEENVVSIIDLREDYKLIFTTKFGMVKSTNASEYFSTKQTISAIKLKDDDMVINVQILLDNKSMTMITKEFMALNFSINDIPVSGRTSMGVKGINLNDGDEVIMSQLVDKGDIISIFTDNAYSKIFKVSELGESVRNRKGLKCMIIKGNTKCLKAYVANDKLNYVLQNEKKLILVENKHLKLANRTSNGNSMTIKNGEKIISVNPYVLL